MRLLGGKRQDRSLPACPIEKLDRPFALGGLSRIAADGAEEDVGVEEVRHPSRAPAVKLVPREPVRGSETLDSLSQGPGPDRRVLKLLGARGGNGNLTATEKQGGLG